MPPHPAEFRQRAVDLVRTGDKPIAQLARELRISESCLRNWIAQHATSAAVTAIGSSFAPPVGEVAASCHGVGVMGAEHPQLVGEHMLERGDGSGRIPPSPRQEARLYRLVSVLGWSGPSTRSWSASSCSNAATAPATSPALPRMVPRNCRVSKVSGWSGPSTRRMSVSSVFSAAAAPVASPACPRIKARVPRAVRVSAWSGPSTSTMSASSRSNAAAAPAASPASPRQ